MSGGFDRSVERLTEKSKAWPPTPEGPPSRQARRRLQRNVNKAGRRAKTRMDTRLAIDADRKAHPRKPDKKPDRPPFDREAYLANRPAKFLNSCAARDRAVR